jgi:hypothetical protein
MSPGELNLLLPLHSDSATTIQNVSLPLNLPKPAPSEERRRVCAVAWGGSLTSSEVTFVPNTLVMYHGNQDVLQGDEFF